MSQVVTGLSSHLVTLRRVRRCIVRRQNEIARGGPAAGGSRNNVRRILASHILQLIPWRSFSHGVAHVSS